MLYKGGYTDRAHSSDNASPYHWRRPTLSKKAKSAWHERRNDDRNVLLRRLSIPSSPPSGSLLERIGGTVEEMEVEGLMSDQIDEETTTWEEDFSDMPFSTSPLESGEVERFLQSVIDAPLSPHASSGIKPTLALETHDLPVDHHSRSSSALYSPTQTVVNSLPSATVPLDHCQQNPLPLGDTMAHPLSASTIEECKKHLAPVLLASARARDSATHLTLEQCHTLLSDDQCTQFFRQAKEMRRQLSSMVSPKLPVHQSSNGSLKRDRVDEADSWTRNTRSKFSSVNPAMSDVSRRDSDITPVDITGARSPPRAPRAMLQSLAASKNGAVHSAQDEALKIRSLLDARGEAVHEALIASPTTENRLIGGASLIELVQQAIKMMPEFSQSVSELDTSTNVSVSQVVPPTHTSAQDVVSHLPTQPGIWFKKQGKKYSEIVNVDVEVSHEMFYMSAERLPSRVRMHLRLCSVPADSISHNTPAMTFEHINDAIDRHALRWPKKGALVVQINPDTEGSKTWLPYNLESDPLDVTSCIRPGKNVFRFIQLTDLSNYTFVLVASSPPEEEAWRSWDWASFVERPHTRASSSTEQHAKTSLSEFAHLPVTVRS